MVQIFRTGSVAAATRKAVTSTLDQARADFGQFVLGSGTRLLSEAKIFVERSDWNRAAMRCGDMAELAAQLGRSAPPDGGSWSQLGIKFREWESTWSRVAGEELRASRNLTVKWHTFTAEAATEFASHHGPFSA
ncbi:MAG TPA: hypothetical protein VNF74_04100 [Terriglobales bacterium]|nr:hypothetical protein [Terriglobales bacterium]